MEGKPTQVQIGQSTGPKSNTELPPPDESKVGFTRHTGKHASDNSLTVILTLTERGVTWNYARTPSDKVQIQL